ncbi:DUF1569 domain-containing protein [Aequorivita lipolytica]|uniref:DUF1569 domain-containing protein n=1 Tax=Aequorivita lipolytica TaxID=153267 RepID=A0A5C6YUD2_9FLAO|nr:DUF1569 domain-containing protein [Aequorivita lipolytica]TXD70889.1 DUF1569 domain-containing protein [Aequorivita lipolytica]SRX49943.1 hypothetical protein AEQU2_00409 [Aequorivita lipolytica]
MKSLFDDEAYTEIKKRLKTLNSESERKWGKMDIGQALHHCQQPLNVSLGKGDVKKQFIPLAFLFKKSLYNDKPWRQNLPTAKSFKISESKDFATEQEALEKLVDEFHTKKNQTQWDPHPIFGKFTPQQWGQMQYKHLDHHLKQFRA